MPASSKNKLSDAYAYEIPSREKLEAHVDLHGDCVFTEVELDLLGNLGPALNKIKEPRERYDGGYELLHKLWPEPNQFRQKTHWIKIKKTSTNESKVGGRAILVHNFAQERLAQKVNELDAGGKPVRIIILKARQIGFSTWIQSKQFDYCFRYPYRNALTVTHHREATAEMHQKVLFVHKNLWLPPPKSRASGSVMEFDDNDSVFRLGTAGNIEVGASETFHHLHCSEIPRWGNTATEVFDSALQALSDEPGTTGFIESTARGAEGEFYEMWQNAEKGLSDWSPFFAPWYWNPAYQMTLTVEERKRLIDNLTKEEKELMDIVKNYDDGRVLTWEQIAWRRWIIRNKTRTVTKFRQEYPSYPAEAFLLSGAPAFNQQILMSLMGGVAKPKWRGDIMLLNADA